MDIPTKGKKVELHAVCTADLTSSIPPSRKAGSLNAAIHRA